MHDHTSETNPLAALGVRLSARGLKIELTDRGLTVVNPNVRGCCAMTAHPSDTITCRRRTEDGGKRWFFTSWQDPIAPADELDDAAMYIVGYLSRHPRDAGVEE